MDIENLLKIRNTLNTEFGALLHTYLSDYITNLAKSWIVDAVELKGMLKLHQVIKDVPQEVEWLRK